MKLSLNWIKEFVTIPYAISPQKLGELLTLHTVEVEKVEKIGDDVIYEIDNKSITHRPDLWGVYGIAREAAAITGGKLKKLEYNAASLKGGEKKIHITVTRTPKQDCPRYMAIALDNIRAASSPTWLKERLEAVGIRPINTIVDATNYCMLETGQPLHAFDLDKLALSDGKVDIIVRRAKKGEFLTTLDGTKRIVNEDILVIADAKNVLALAGIMGGADTEICEGTSRILIESANFDSILVRKAANALGLRTEASARFEKSLDPYLPPQGLLRCALLLQRLLPEACIASELVDSHNLPDEEEYKKVLNISVNRIQEKIGVDMPEPRMIRILISLGFEARGRRGTLEVTVPTWRAGRDITIPDDIIEEVARVYGYDAIIPSLPSTPIEPPLENKERQLERTIKRIASEGLGFIEVYNYSFTSEGALSLLKISDEDSLVIKNPLSQDAVLLRKSLLPHLVENAKQNLRYQDALRLFEVGKVYENKPGGEQIAPFDNSTLPRQDSMFGGVYAEKSNATPFYAVKQAIQSILDQLGIPYTWTREEKYGNKPFCAPSAKSALSAEGLFSPPPFGGSKNKGFPWHPTRWASVKSGNVPLGIIGELHPIAARNAGIKIPLALFELNEQALLKTMRGHKLYTPLPKYPSVTVDVSLLIDRKVLWGDIEDAVKGSTRELIERIEVFDLYEGKNLPQGKKSIAFHVTYRSKEKTLTEEEVKKVRAHIEETLKKEFGAEIR